MYVRAQTCTHNKDVLIFKSHTELGKKHMPVIPTLSAQRQNDRELRVAWATLHGSVSETTILYIMNMDNYQLKYF